MIFHISRCWKEGGGGVLVYFVSLCALLSTPCGGRIQYLWYEFAPPSARKLIKLKLWWRRMLQRYVCCIGALERGTCVRLWPLDNGREWSHVSCTAHACYGGHEELHLWHWDIVWIEHLWTLDHGGSALAAPRMRWCWICIPWPLDNGRSALAALRIRWYRICIPWPLDNGGVEWCTPVQVLRVWIST